MKSFTCILICVLTGVSLFCINVSAVQVPFETTVIEMTNDDKSTYTDEFDLKSFNTISESYKNHLIFSFDVSESGKCVLLFNNGYVVVLKSNGKASKILKFDENILNTRSRSAIIKWNGDNLELILGYDVSFLFTTEGELIDIWSYETELTTLPNPKKITVGDFTYEMKCKSPFLLFTNDYDTLMVTDTDGNQRILFKSEKGINGELVLFIIVFSAIHLTVGGVALYIIVSHKKKKRQPTVSGHEFKKQGSVPGSTK